LPAASVARTQKRYAARAGNEYVTQYATAASVVRSGRMNVFNSFLPR
jgi:hypothetical protein